MSELQVMNGPSFKRCALLVALVLEACSFSSTAAPCDAGHQAAIRGKSNDAIALWEKLATDTSPKEKGRAIITCLRSSGIAASNADAAQWLIDTASKSGGRALLYVGMNYASGAGVPIDHAKARQYLERARAVAPRDATDMLKVLDASEKSSPNQS
jgi:TPR repeat protein